MGHQRLSGGEADLPVLAGRGVTPLEVQRPADPLAEPRRPDVGPLDREDPVDGDRALGVDEPRRAPLGDRGVVVAGEVLIGAREMRTLGIEAAYAVRESTLDAPAGGDVEPADLVATARRVARSWSW